MASNTEHTSMSILEVIARRAGVATRVGLLIIAQVFLSLLYVQNMTKSSITHSTFPQGSVQNGGQY